jgi:hypothetical protein
MPLHLLTTILAEYPKAKIEPFGGNPLANFLRIRPQMTFRMPLVISVQV